MVKNIDTAHRFTYGGASVYVFHANKGEGIPMHSHDHSHATTCMAGSCKLTCNGKVLIADKTTQPVDLFAGSNHEIEALEDNTVFVNVFAEGKY